MQCLKAQSNVYCVTSQQIVFSSQCLPHPVVCAVHFRNVPRSDAESVLFVVTSAMFSLSLIVKGQLL